MTARHHVHLKAGLSAPEESLGTCSARPQP